MKFFVVPLLFSAACGPLLADSLTGRVLDPQGEAVANTDLTLFDRNSGELHKASSSVKGEYGFQNIPAGTYLMEAQTSAASMTTSETVTVSGATSKDVTLSIARPTIRVEVTATNTPLSEQEVAKVIDVVDAQEINARDEFSIAEVVRNVPGVRVRQQGGPGGFTAIQTRGLRNYDTAVLIDGLRFRDGAGLQGDATAFIEDMMVVDTSRIEYLRGSGSALYGTNALSGVINVNSNQGGGSTRGSIRAEGGGLGMLRGAANIGGGAADDRLVYSGGFSHLNVVNGIRGNTPYRNSSGQAFGKFRIKPKMSLSGRFWGSDALLRSLTNAAFPSSVTANFPASGAVKAIPLAESQVALYEKGLPFSAGNATFVPSVSDPDGRQASSFVAAAVIFNHELTENSSYRLSYQGVRTNRTLGNGPAGTSGFEPLTSESSRFDGRTHTVQARLDSRIGRYNLINVGYEFERENYLNVETGANINIDNQNHAFFGQDQLQLMDGRLQIAASGRIQYFRLQGLQVAGQQNPYSGVTVQNPDNAYTGDVSVAYFIRSSQTKLRGHAGNSYRAPSPYERFGASYFSGFYSYYGDPRLKPEHATAFDFGLDQWLMNSKVRLGATFFYTNLRDTIIFDFANFPSNDPFGRFGGYENSKGGGIARGVELSTQITPTSKTNVQFNYTFTNANSRAPTIGTSFFETLGVSKHQFSAVATQHLTRRLSVTFDYFIAGEYSYSPFGANGRRLIFSGPNKADFVANYSIPVGDKRSVDVYGKLENAFDVRYFELGSTTPGIWGIGGIKFNF